MCNRTFNTIRHILKNGRNFFLKKEDRMDNATQVGSLIVRARTGYGLYPLENARVTVTLEDKENSKVVADV